MPQTYSITEPHPSVPTSRPVRLLHGIGGAGNYKRYSTASLTPGTSASGPPSRLSVLPRRPLVCTTGRGGAGNVFRTPASNNDEQRVFSFDEELERQREPSTAIFHIGRGGAGNSVDTMHHVIEGRRPASLASDADSVASSESQLGKKSRKLSQESTRA